MARTSSGKRYAQAALELALEKGELESWQMSLSKIAELSKDEKLMALLENPKLPFDAKRRLLEERLGEVNPLALNLAYLLASRGRLNLAPGILQQYDKLLDTHYGIEHAEVVTALALDDEDKERISSRLGEMTQRKVIIDAQVDPSVVGGFRAKVGDMLIDGSIRSRLESLRRSLAGVGKR
jgi:F-type H+-transporting ATPase subunit delta